MYFMKNIMILLTAAVITASCNNKAERQAAEQARQLDSIKNEMARQRVIDSMNEVAAAKEAEQQAAQKATRTTTVYHEVDHTSSNAGAAPATTTTKQRKGIGPVGAGAIIGAGAGAVTGAMVDKNKGRGAVIGGILGAGAGAGTGAIIKGEQKKKDAKKQQQEDQ